MTGDSKYITTVIIPTISRNGNVNKYICIPINTLEDHIINDTEEHQRRVLDDSVEGTNRGTNTSPVPNPSEQEEEVIIPNRGPQARITPA